MKSGPWEPEILLQALGFPLGQLLAQSWEFLPVALTYDQRQVMAQDGALILFFPGWGTHFSDLFT